MEATRFVRLEPDRSVVAAHDDLRFTLTVCGSFIRRLHESIKRPGISSRKDRELLEAGQDSF